MAAQRKIKGPDIQINSTAEFNLTDKTLIWVQSSQSDRNFKEDILSEADTFSPVWTKLAHGNRFNQAEPPGQFFELSVFYLHTQVLYLCRRNATCTATASGTWSSRKTITAQRWGKVAKDNSFPTQTSTDWVTYTQSQQHHTNPFKTFRNTTQEPETWYYHVISSNWITALWTLTLRSSRQQNSLDNISQPRLRNRTVAFQSGWVDVQVGSGLPASC